MAPKGVEVTFSCGCTGTVLSSNDEETMVTPASMCKKHLSYPGPHPKAWQYNRADDGVVLVSWDVLATELASRFDAD